MQNHLTFTKLARSIRDLHNELAAQVSRAVNVSLTLRNWLIGLYILEYEQNGEDRAQYGEALLDKLAAELDSLGVARMQARELRRYRLFYTVYPQIWESLTPEFRQQIRLPANLGVTDHQITSTESRLWAISPSELIQKLSFTHLAELIAIDDTTKRSFYEVECIRGNWSVRELKRQIGSLYYERSGLSLNKQKLSELAQQNAEQAEPKLSIRDPYVFEFLGLKPKEVMSESHLEDQLIDKLEAFLLELGHGFCFEARQKRILIGDEHFFVDLVFYHRILKCHALVEYALAGMDNQLFVSKYQLELPKKDEMQRFIEAQLREARQ